MQRWYLLSLTLLIGVFFFFSVFFWAATPPEYLLAEGRKPAERPPLTKTGWFSGAFSRDFESWVDDTFPVRDQLLDVGREMNNFYFFTGLYGDLPVLMPRPQNEQSAGTPLRPEDLTYSPPAFSPLAALAFALPFDPELVVEPLPELDYPDLAEVSRADDIIIIGDRAMEIPYAVPQNMTAYAAAVSALAQAMPQRSVYSLITPNGAEFYTPESMHAGQASQSEMINNTYAQMEDVQTVDAYTALRKHADEYVYFRTDHHWTALGAYYAYTAFCQTAGLNAIPLADFETGRYENFVGSMYGFTKKYPVSKVLKDNPDYLDYYLPVTPSSMCYYLRLDLANPVSIPVVSANLKDSFANKYLCFIGGDTPLAIIESEAGTGRSILVLKESYGNAFIPFLTSHYDRIYVLDMREFNNGAKERLNLPSFMEQNEIDELLILSYPFSVNNDFYSAVMKRAL